MQQDHEASVHSNETDPDSFLGSFTRVPSGLDPAQVYGYFLKMSARIRSLEDQARRVSAPFLLEAALREASEARTQSAQAAERAYNEAVKASQQEGQRLQGEAERQASQMIESARAAVEDVQREADRLLEQARQEATRIRQEADEWNHEADEELERLSVEYANFLQRLLDRRKSSAGPPEGGQPSPLSGTAPPPQAPPLVSPEAAEQPEPATPRRPQSFETEMSEASRAAIRLDRAEEGPIHSNPPPGTTTSGYDHEYRHEQSTLPQAARPRAQQQKKRLDFWNWLSGVLTVFLSLR